MFYYMEQSANKELEQNLDMMKIAGHETITIKIPINLPYQVNWRNYERVDGEMTYKGVTYKYFKRKIYNDSLELVCVNFKEKTIISNKSDDYFKKVNDLASNGSTKKQTQKQQKQDEYCRLELDKTVDVYIEVKETIKFGGKSIYPSGFTENAEIPPEV
ncbi:MAG: hypothetical protein JWP71_3440 [Mucilaginibacter sp.]|nr:hypothetical protein [Mucilaginibacter sp.]